MNYAILGQLATILRNLQSDAASLGFTIASLMIIIYVIIVMTTDDTNVALHQKRWENLRKVFICAVVIAAAGAIATFGKQLGGGLTSQ
jgi:hypothetical protein